MVVIKPGVVPFVLLSNLKPPTVPVLANAVVEDTTFPDILILVPAVSCVSVQGIFTIK